MSRVGKYPVPVPTGVTVTMAGKTLSVKGKLGELKLDTTDDVETKVEDGKVWVSARNETKRARAQWGTTRATINNMVKGVSTGWKRTLELNGVGFTAKVQGKSLVLVVGFSHDVILDIPEGVKATVNKNIIDLESSDREVVGTFAAKIRGVQPPEPYLGKGIKYSEEKIRRKAGKTGKK